VAFTFRGAPIAGCKQHSIFGDHETYVDMGIKSQDGRTCQGNRFGVRELQEAASLIKREYKTPLVIE